MIEAGGTFGVGENTDVSLRVNSATFLTARLKQQVLGTKSSRFAASIGVDGGVNVGSALIGYFYAYGAFPAYVSFHPSEAVAVYVVPRYVLVTVDPFAPPPDAERRKTSAWTWSGLSYGVSLGRQRRLVLELTHLRNSVWPSHIAVGISARVN